jgi:hypothetical protein
MAWTEGRDGAAPTYRERLWPSPLIVVIALGLAGLLSAAYGAAYGAALGWGAGLGLSALAILLLTLTSPVVHVDECVLRAGRARLPLHVIADIHTLDAATMRRKRRDIDPRAYLLLRAWSTGTGVLLTLDDSRDPHPQWLISTRHPERLRASVRKALQPPATT